MKSLSRHAVIFTAALALTSLSLASAFAQQTSATTSS